MSTENMQLQIHDKASFVRLQSTVSDVYRYSRRHRIESQVHKNISMKVFLLFFQKSDA